MCFLNGRASLGHLSLKIAELILAESSADEITGIFLNGNVPAPPYKLSSGSGR
jgi:hypothetical protein